VCTRQPTNYSVPTAEYTAFPNPFVKFLITCGMEEKAHVSVVGRI